MAAIWGADWDPGALCLLHRFFMVLIPKVHTETTGRPGISLHHTLATTAIDGVHDAMCTVVHSVDGKTQRYVYVELASDAEIERVTTLVRDGVTVIDLVGLPQLPGAWRPWASAPDALAAAPVPAPH